MAGQTPAVQSIDQDNEELASLLAQQSNQTLQGLQPRTQGESLGSYLSGLDPKTGTPPAPSVKNESDAQIAAGLKKVEPLLDSGGTLSLAGATPKQTGEVTSALEAGYSPTQVADTVFPKDPPQTAAQKAAAASKAQVTAQEAQAKEVANSPWTQLGNSLAQQYQQAEAPAANLMSGAQTVPGQNAASQTALALLGESGASPDAATLGAWAGAANAATAPVTAAEAAEGAQYSAEAGPITKAIMAYGQANALSDETAPEASWLSALASHVTSNLSYYGSVPTSDLGVLEGAPGVASALQQAGGYGAQTGAGLTPLQDISVKNGKVSVASPAGGGASSPGTVVPTAVPAPSASAG